MVGVMLNKGDYFSKRASPFPPDDLWVQVEEDEACYRSGYHYPARYTLYAAHFAYWRAKVAVANRILVAMAAHSFTYDADVFAFLLCM